MTIFNYTVNYVDLIIVGILLIFGIVGQQRGIFITLVNFIRYVLGFSLCMFSTDRLSQPIYDNFLQERVQNTVNEKIVTSSNIDEIMANINNAVDSLPNYIKNSIDVSSLKLSSNNISQNITNELFEPVIIGILKVLIFVVVFILFFGITGAIIHHIRRKNKDKRKENKKKSFTVFTDRLLGLIFGMLKGALVVFVFVSVITYLLGVPNFANNQFLKTAADSQLYQLLLNYNPFNVITEGII
ncbi:CvpA family protein [uncultured Eubacterium sp.]|uniref:CvpA family protein n=1 Tax=uncultured Eubacterium sp. TaxID=165185 RepID=UPI00280612B1|nr:CvpA family protein [uncultured Eubacterium sp.]